MQRWLHGLVQRGWSQAICCTRRKLMRSHVSTSLGPPEFDDEFRQRLYDLLRWRRDVRRFKRAPLSQGTIERLIGIACLSPSVGLSEPWRFVIVEDEARRAL